MAARGTALPEALALHLDGGDASLGPAARRGEPLYCAVPLPRGAVNGTACLELWGHADEASDAAAAGEGGTAGAGVAAVPLAGAGAETGPLPLQVQVTARWPDGSLQWVVLHWLHDGSAGFRLRFGTERDFDSIETLLARPQPCQDDGATLRVPTSVGEFVCAPGAFAWRAEVAGGAGSAGLPAAAGGAAVPGEAGAAGVSDVAAGADVTGVAEDAASGDARAPAAGAIAPRLLVETRDGAPLTLDFAAPVLREQGAVFVDIDSRGVARGRGTARLQADVNMRLWPATGLCRLDITLRNPRAAAHPGGRWPLGVEGSLHLARAELRVALPGGWSTARLWPEPSATPLEARHSLSLYQDSSGGAHWDSRTHLTANGRIAPRFRGYRLQVDDTPGEGLRATPLLAVAGDGVTHAFALTHFWQCFPRALEVDAEGVCLGLFPGACEAGHELQGGEQKTHRIYLQFGLPDGAETPAAAPPLAWTAAPALVQPSEQWFAATEAVPYLLPESDDPSALYRTFVRAAIEGPDSFAAKREAIDEYGWRNFGDLYADHEAAFHRGASPLISHYNNQYDGVAGFAMHYLRTGDRRWYDAFSELAWHVADIDIYHTDEDRAAYNHGMFWHTHHYTDAATSSHRTYPDLPGVHGGGPSPEHLYSHGLLLYYYLTGDRRFRDVVIALGQYVIDADDGSRTVFRWVDAGPTGFSSSSGSVDYHGPGRGPGNGLEALLNAYRLSGEDRFIDKLEELLRRCVHPEDDLPTLDLGNVEARWFYMVFLRGLCRYLDWKIECGSIDAMFTYTRDSLLHYLRWAARHEYPYLDRPEILEFPTETWAAQELRKSEVFGIGARYADGAERELFRERARFFFDTALRQLAGHDTRGYCRPLVLMMNFGVRHAWLMAHPEAVVTARGPALRFPPKPVFLRQRRRVVEKLKYAGAGAAAAGLLLGAGALLLGGG